MNARGPYEWAAIPFKISVRTSNLSLLKSMIIKHLSKILLMSLIYHQITFIILKSDTKLRGCKLIPETTFKRGYNE